MDTTVANSEAKKYGIAVVKPKRLGLKKTTVVLKEAQLPQTLLVLLSRLMNYETQFRQQIQDQYDWFLLEISEYRTFSFSENVMYIVESRDVRHTYLYWHDVFYRFYSHITFMKVSETSRFISLVDPATARRELRRIKSTMQNVRRRKHEKAQYRSLATCVRYNIPVDLLLQKSEVQQQQSTSVVDSDDVSVVDDVMNAGDHDDGHHGLKAADGFISF